MDSLIEAAEKNFEAKTSVSFKTRLAMKVLNMYLFNKVLTLTSGCNPRESLFKYLSQLVKDLHHSDKVNEDPVFANALWVLYFENAKQPIEDPTLLADFASVALQIKRNSDVKKLLEMALNTQFMISEHVADEEEREKRTKVFEVSSLAYNLTRSFDKAISLLRKVEQREDMNFSVELFNNVIDCCMKSKQEHAAEDLLNEYTENVDENIRKHPKIITTMITGYSKLGKVDRALTIY